MPKETARNCGSVPPLCSLSCESKNTSSGFGCFQFVHLSQLRLSQSAMARQSSNGSRMNTSSKICNANSTNGLVPNVPMQCKVNQYGQCPMWQCKVNQWPASSVPVQSQPMASVQCASAKSTNGQCAMYKQCPCPPHQSIEHRSNRLQFACKFMRNIPSIVMK